MPRLEQGLAGRAFAICVLPGGEEQKTLGNVATHHRRAGRPRGSTATALVLALGGGVIGDIAGFAAASYQRGIAIVQLPTTLLAQVDSSVGGKTGVNHPGGKNLIGAFHQPTAVITDTDTLSTLPDRQLRAGFTEIVKAALVADAAFFGWLEANVRARARARSRGARRGDPARLRDQGRDRRRGRARAGPARAPEPRPHLRPRDRGGRGLRQRAARRGGRRRARARRRAVRAHRAGCRAPMRGACATLLSAAGLPVDPPRLGRARMLELMAMDKKVKGGQAPPRAARRHRPARPSPRTIRARRSRRCSRNGRAHEARPRSGCGLAPWAALERSSRGRRHPEPPADYRGEFQRDRDRIIHSNAFRRLVYKTQVFINHEGDMYRTRLTHSIEVAQIGRSVALALSLSEPLTEAICLAHDLGHTPFGHAGQDVLNDCMREYGGFEHNLQSLRVVDELEERYAEFRGLNLTLRDARGDPEALLARERAPARRARAALHRAPPAGPRGADRGPRRRHRLQQPRRRRRPALGTRHARGAARRRRCSRASTMRCSRVTASCPGRRLVHEVIRRMIHEVASDLIEESARRLAAAQSRRHRGGARAPGAAHRLLGGARRASTAR